MLKKVVLGRPFQYPFRVAAPEKRQPHLQEYIRYDTAILETPVGSGFLSLIREKNFTGGLLAAGTSCLIAATYVEGDENFSVVGPFSLILELRNDKTVKAQTFNSLHFYVQARNRAYELVSDPADASLSRKFKSARRLPAKKTTNGLYWPVESVGSLNDAMYLMTEGAKSFEELKEIFR